MAYPGDAGLDPKVQQRILTAFGEAARLYREGHPEEARTILRSILEVDPRFGPAQRLDAAIVSGAPVDLGQLLGEVTAAASLDTDALLAKAQSAHAARDYQGALRLLQEILKELPGHAGARALLGQVQSAMRASTDVQGYVVRTRDALDAGLVEEARSFLALVRNLDPGNAAIPELAARLEIGGRPVEKEPAFEFEVFEHTPAAAPPAAPEPAVERPTPLMTPPAFTAPAPAPAPGPVAKAGSVLLEDAPPVELPPSADGGMTDLQQGLFDMPDEVPPNVEEPDSFAPDAGDFAAAFAPPAPAALGSTAATLPPVDAAPPPLDAAPPPASEPPAEEQAFVFQSQGDDFAFSSTPADTPGDAPPAPVPTAFADEPALAPPSGDDSSSRIQELLDLGQAAFQRGDYQGAIDTWSRIYLVDAHHAEAETRIEQARRRREEIDRQAEHRFYEAREAFDQGRFDDARALCQEVLTLQPQHLEAHDLLVRMETPSVPPPPPAPPPAGSAEDDLFRDDFVPARISSGEAARPGAFATPRRSTGQPGAEKAGRGRLPMPLVGGIVALLVVLAGAGYLLRGKVFTSSTSTTMATLAEADRLANAGSVQQAIDLLQTVREEGEVGRQVTQRILDYRNRLKAKSTAPTKSDGAVIAEAVKDGLRLKAMRLIRDGLNKVPGDPELLEFQRSINAVSPVYPALLTAVEGRKWEVVRQNAGYILREHPGDPEAQRLWSGATFNQAIVLLRQYQVAPAHALLEELVRFGDDPEAVRLRQFASSYLSRQVDPRYQIFVANVELRGLE